MSSAEDVAAAIAALDELTRRLRRECPWDREQDERSIVPHTVEEAYELADAALSGDDGRLVDELGDVLFQVHFLALLLEERGAGDLAAVADACAAKLVRRHPHVFGDAEAASAAEVLRHWEAIKRTEPGREEGAFGGMPATLPALTLARKLQRRAAATGAEMPDSRGALACARAQLDALADAGTREERFEAIGEALLSLAAVGREWSVDPELALRAAAERFRRRVEAAPR